MKRPPLIQTIIVIIGVGILCALGTWQVQRLQWKSDMIEKLEAGYAALENNQAPLLQKAELQKISAAEQPMAIGRVRGSLRRDGAILLGPKPDEGRIGYHLLIPLNLIDGGTIIVNTGWVDAIWKDDPADRLVMLPQENVTITGVLRKADWNRFTPKNSPSQDQWFRADIDQIAAAKNLNDVYPFILYASASQPELHDVKPLDQRWLPRNKHMQYALFWYAMALTLIVVYGFYWKSRKAL